MGRDDREAIRRCDREIAAIAQLAKNGHTDVHGIALGLNDWNVEKRLIRQEAYQQFLKQKQFSLASAGFAIENLNPKLFPFQRDITKWSLKKGKAALFEDCGLGKTPQELEWSQQVFNSTGKPVINFAPLAVSKQTQREGVKFDIPVTVCREQSDVQMGVNIANYEMLKNFDAREFGGMVIDESSILKGDGPLRRDITDFAQNIPYRLAATATPAPNDHMELGNHAEFLGIMSKSEMLSTFFVHDGENTSKWRLKGHAEAAFWKWVASWAVMIRKPSDLGYEDGDFQLPPITYHQHTVEAEWSADYLFPVEAKTMQERQGARRDSLQARVKLAAELIWKTQKTSNGSGGFRKIESGGLLIGTISEQRIEPELPHSLPSREQLDSSREGDTIRPTENESLLILKPTEKKSHPSGDPTTSEITTESPSPTMSVSLENRAEDALYVKPPRKLSRTKSSTLTIATQPEGSGGCSAPLAISESGSLKTIPIIFAPPSNIWSGPQWVVWCGLNDEQDHLAKLLGDLCVSVYGTLSSEEKERRLDMWLRGERQVLISKPSICGMGLNLQQCYNMAFVGLSDSWESVYQATRRIWRFGQREICNVHFITGELEGAVVRNIERKEKQAAQMAESMLGHMREVNTAEIHGTVREQDSYNATKKVKVPTWL